jgi:D-alanyl-lipoteichoic acid acyltransferase DltB (MBOAT superfamily)
MNFAQSRFWVLLGCGLGVILLLRWLLRRPLGENLTFYDKAALAGLGLFLLASVSWVTCLIFVVVAAVSYGGMVLLARLGAGPWPWLAVLVPLQLAPLFYYKYSNFVLNEVLGGRYEGLRDLVIPAGLSFYTFQMIAFVVDTLAARKPLPGPLDFLNFGGFFPQVVAGPIERRESLLPQVQRFRFRWLPAQINEGATWIVVGLFFKRCLADNAAVYFDGTSTTNPYAIWLANVLFGLRIYYDFAGYSLIALGLGRCLGIGLTVNFLSPYCATSLVEFWRRWHVSLSQWFRDYVYVPLGGRQKRWLLNVAVVFVVSGIWHGAGWNFIVWGALHGAALILNRLLGPRVNVPRSLGWALTMGVTFFGWLAFYETRPGYLLAKAQTLFTPSAYGWPALQQALSRWAGGDQFVLMCLGLLSGAVLLAEWQSVARHNDPYCLLRRPAVAVGLVILTVLLAPGTHNAFIYFAF